MNLLGPGGSRRRKRLLGAGVMLAPILAVQVAGFVSETGPASAPGAIVDAAASTQPIAAPPARPPLSDRQLAAIAAAAAATSDSDLRSPMDAPELEENVAPAPIEPGPAGTTDPEIAPVPDVIVGAIIGDSDQAVALIASRPLRVGADLGDGWSIERIDARIGEVTIRHADGRSAAFRTSRR